MKIVDETNINDFPNFSLDEIKCKCGGQYCNGFPSGFSYELLRQLQEIRNHFGSPVYITSGLRCTEWNRIQQGVSNSKHTMGQAVDFYVSGVSYSNLKAFVDTLPYNQYTYNICDDVMHHGITPPEEEQIPTIAGAERNEQVSQILVNASELRIRTEANTGSNIVGYAETGGIYNIYEIVENEGYKWFKIDDNKWLANINVEELPIVIPTEEKEDTQMIEELNKKIEELNKIIKDQENEIKALDKQIDAYKFKFTATKDCKIRRSLSKGDILIIK